MSIIPILAIVIRAAWIALEVHYLSRHRIETAKDHDGHSAKLWDLANALELIGMMLGFTSVGRFQQGRSLIAVSGLFLLLTGILIRLKAIRALGEFFTGKVLIKDNHRFISSGPYRYVRHPGYSGALLAHLGLGLSFSNWFSLAFSVIPFFIAALYRMHVEEQVLHAAFGEQYRNYARTTSRLIPKLY